MRHGPLIAAAAMPHSPFAGANYVTMSPAPEGSLVAAPLTPLMPAGAALARVVRDRRDFLHQPLPNARAISPGIGAPL